MLAYRISLQKPNQILYLDTHTLDICAILEDLLQTGMLHMVFTDQPFFPTKTPYTHLTLDLDILQYPMLHTS